MRQVPAIMTVPSGRSRGAMRWPEGEFSGGDPMAIDSRDVATAQVVLRSATGRTPDGNALITAETIKDFTPSSEAVARATTFFESAGFEVGPLAGISFSISAPTSRFQETFKTQLRRGE